MRFSEPVSRRKVWREIIFTDADTVRSLDLFLKNRISRMETKCSNVLLHARVRVVSTVFEERLDEYRCRSVRRLSVIGERIVCLFAHENKLKKKN